MVKAEIRRHFGVAEEKLHVIYNGVDLEAFHPRLREQHRAAVRGRLGIPEDAMLHLFVGSGFERKGVFRLLRAFARGADARAHLVVVGKDKAESRAAADARALGIAGRVHLVGGQKEVGPWYGAADSFVLPTLYDPFPNAALEAMAAGLPVITSVQSGAAELVDASNGRVCDALDEAALARFLREFDPAGAARLGEYARRTAMDFGLDTMARKLVQLYRTLLTPGNPG
jgi:UDP-glucose:(heptosyl)LPS alpha-1,3-glucosyltransferase